MVGIALFLKEIINKIIKINIIDKKIYSCFFLIYITFNIIPPLMKYMARRGFIYNKKTAKVLLGSLYI